MRKNDVLKLLLFLALFFAVGALTGKAYERFWPSIKQAVYTKSVLYSAPDKRLLEKFDNADKVPLSWRALLPEEERDAIENYQEPSEEELRAQILEAIEVASDRTYRPPPPSVQTVEHLLGKAVSISGFIVPIEMIEGRRVKSFFFVPYYGACIHYPPPPPNQMIFVQLIDGFVQQDMQQAYTINGFLEEGLFEDPLGTSAYMLNVASIKEFHGQPDDFRQH